MLATSPSNVAIVNPAHSARAASSVNSERPSRAARRWASRMMSKRNACGVCAIRKRARSGVASTLPAPSISLMVSATETVGDRRARAVRRVDRAGDHRLRDERPRGVVDQHDVGPLSRQRFEPGMNGSLPRRAAGGRGRMVEPAHRSVEHLDVIGIHHRLHRDHVRMPAERRHGAEDHRLPTDRTVLLRSARAGAEPTAGCDEDGCGSLR